ncbi:MAG TPA: phosphatidate cytidylyltransferase [Longimicrobiaceae bacterium]|nr:phosphatidate cytidylyltransferase [Longimicrobiaceae bacterium]
MAGSETLTRTAVALVGIPLAAGAIYLGGWVLAGVLAVLVVLSTLEVYRMGAQKQARALAALGAAAAAGVVALAALAPERGLENEAFGWLVVALVLAACTLAIWTHGVEGEPLLSVSVTLFGALYPALLVFALFLRHLPGVEGALHGTALVLAPAVLTWANDSFAYFAGRAWGKQKLIPRVSPGKTVAGAVGALVGTVPVAVGYTFLLASFPTYRLGLVEGAALGVLVAVAAQVGDLAESLLKRDAGVKDSGRLLPGHGGALDRFDSLFFTLPAAYAFFRFVAGA